MKTQQQIGRLALRQEGANWNAYYALPDTMEGALPLASIKLAIVMGNPDLKQRFMDLMRAAVSDIIEGKIGVRPTWNEPHVAPESERAGSA